MRVLEVWASIRAPVAAQIPPATANGISPQYAAPDMTSIAGSPERRTRATRLDGARVGAVRPAGGGQFGRDHPALVPTRVGGQDQRRDLARRGHRRLHRLRSI